MPLEAAIAVVTLLRKNREATHELAVLSNWKSALTKSNSTARFACVIGKADDLVSQHANLFGGRYLVRVGVTNRDLASFVTGWASRSTNASNRAALTRQRINPMVASRLACEILPTADTGRIWTPFGFSLDCASCRRREC